MIQVKMQFQECFNDHARREISSDRLTVPEKAAMSHLNTVLIWSAHVGPAVDVERLSIRHVKHANREPAPLSLTVLRVPLECGVDWTTGKENRSEHLLVLSGCTAMQ